MNLLLTTAAPRPHHYSSGQNEYAQVLNGAHLFPPFRAETVTPLTDHITALY